MKLGEKVLIPAGYFPETGKARPMKPAVIVGFGRHLYSAAPLGDYDWLQVQDGEGTWTISRISAKEIVETGGTI